MKAINTERDNEIVKLAMTEEISVIASTYNITKERVKQILKKEVTPEQVKRIHSLISCEGYTEEMVSQQLQVPLYAVDYVLQYQSPNGKTLRDAPCEENESVTLAVRKTEEAKRHSQEPEAWVDRQDLPKPEDADIIHAHITLPRSQVETAIEQWINTQGKFSALVKVIGMTEVKGGDFNIHVVI